MSRERWREMEEIECVRLAQGNILEDVVATILA